LFENKSQTTVRELDASIIC